ESAHRGFLLSGGAAEAARFGAATAELGPCLERLAGLAIGNPDQARRVGEPRRACGAYMEILRHAGPVTSLPRDDALASREAKVHVDRGVTQIWEAEDDEIESWVAARDAAILWGSSTLAVASGLSLIMLAATWLLARRELAS